MIHLLKITLMFIAVFSLALFITISSSSTGKAETIEKFWELNEWIGAPCISDDDCGEYKCKNSACG
jgi:hypothetical protein